MCQMLLSINPKYVASILQGKKLYEYRKFRCRADVDKIIIYATSPQKQVVAEAEIEDIIEDDVLSVWRKTKNYSGITYAFFRKYYKGKKKAVAYRLKNLVIYEKPLSLEDIGVSCAPQSYRYISTKL
ncbi:MAG: ASCH domain-containing protein [Lachnospiraceae bacterium]|nr:ASCH domain-containing protein [Lachnospiraceae bacterium]MDE6252969.1 ASCH domain-containing protein [Lachnospiraceae bacterium]